MKVDLFTLTARELAAATGSKLYFDYIKDVEAALTFYSFHPLDL